MGVKIIKARGAPWFGGVVLGIYATFYRSTRHRDGFAAAALRVWS